MAATAATAVYTLLWAHVVTSGDSHGGTRLPASIGCLWAHACADVISRNAGPNVTLESCMQLL